MDNEVRLCLACRVKYVEDYDDVFSSYHASAERIKILHVTEVTLVRRGRIP